jgi:UDP-N-acetylmuramoyl-L-alanyl-D-glutamate--2,6-diaminopimelate ligase
VLAVTGTNGKTSTAWWLAQALSALAEPIACAVVGTLGVGRPPAVESNGLTTPDPVLLQRQFRRFVTEGVKACAIEASSIGLAERRLDGTRIRVALFTNFTQDHLDYHGSMDSYWQAKRQLFDWPGLQSAVVNVDDPKGAELARALAGRALDLWTVSCTAPARLQAQGIGHTHDGLRFTVAGDGEQAVLQTRLIGHYNVANLLGVIGAMRALGVPLQRAVSACGQLLPVPGRMERLGAPGQPVVAVDYAHTPDALDKALAALRPLAAQRGGRLWCVFGCGGDRDNGKRPLMAAVAERGADRVVVTSDNPRSEAPEAIIAQVVSGLSRPDSAGVQADRRRAVAETIAAAAPKDVILLAGKGHEDYQEILGVRHPYDDRVAAQAALAARGAG